MRKLLGWTVGGDHFWLTDQRMMYAHKASAIIVAIGLFGVSGCSKDLTDPCTGAAVSEADQYSKFGPDQSAYVRAQAAEAGIKGPACPSPNEAMDVMRAKRDFEAQAQAQEAEQQEVARVDSELPAEDRRAYRMEVARGKSPSEAAQMAGPMRRLCEAQGGDDCR